MFIFHQVLVEAAPFFTLSTLFFKVRTKLIEHLLRRHQPHKQKAKKFEILLVDKGRPSRGSVAFLKNKAVLPGKYIYKASPLHLNSVSVFSYSEALTKRYFAYSHIFYWDLGDIPGL